MVFWESTVELYLLGLHLLVFTMVREEEPGAVVD